MHIYILLFQLNSVYFAEPTFLNLPPRALESVHINCPRTSHRIRYNRKENWKKTFTGKKVKKPSGEQQRRTPLPGWTEATDVMCTDDQSYRDTTHSMTDRVFE